ncbi:septal ring lytic transglycosylase RlpA family protein [Patescibacteria group bacterium]|nr:septal ring lytic transglycosylase RlpA family protein [Patescibacteria group bacterium]MBU1016167.1 septal ring lytic transglycosylase RlpA family protein [Patescibacteria group bacterium]MBU1684715.1 septal ring lytic transglycosylase RlpA family protein [Patescibacteria group bacterium]MBU1938900.1 septal ring lytic transglycosylase RlpA family protein [Patescibacteria group bacterium]
MKKITALSFFVAAFLVFSQAAHAVFSDVTSSHEYYEAIEYLQENGIVEGYADGSYRPDQQVNRAEALKIILLGSSVLVPEIQDQDIFPDVLYGTWYAKYAAKGRNLGIVSGDSGTGMFRPGDTINLAEILKILLKTNRVETTAPDENPYADVPADAWFAPYFSYSFSISLLPQTADEDVKPATPVTRGLMAQLMYQLAMKPEGYQEGKASYYGATFHGKGTASGEVFDASLFTAAHRTLPFGTWLKVRNLNNGKETYVRVNDRGPYGDENRIVDLSKAAFEAIAPLSQGIASVSITPVSGPPGGSSASEVPAACPDKPTFKYYSESTFENITLNASLPNTFLADEVFFLEGSSASAKKEVSAFLAPDAKTQFPFTSTKNNDGTFSIPVFFPDTGSYSLGVIPGDSGSSVVESVTVLPGSCLTQSEDSGLPVPTDLKLSISQGDLVIQWTQDPGHDVSKVSFIQGTKRKDYFVRGKVQLTPHYPDFEGWSAGDTQVQIRSASLGGASFSEPGAVTWSPTLSAVFKAETHHQYIVEDDKVNVLSLPSTLKSGSPLTFKVDPKVNLNAAGWVILPNGQTEDLTLSSPTHTALKGTLGTDIFPASASDVRLSYTPKSGSLHFFEINDEQGIAAVNIPVYTENTYPLIPNPADLADLQPVGLSSDLGALKSEMLQLVNADRAAQGLASLSLNSGLTQLAQAKSNDMAERNYFGHWNPEGLTSNDLRKNYAIAQYVSENIARDVSVSLAEYGLMRSASHRSNILNEEWQRVGFGFTQDGGNGIIFVQIFSDDPIDFSDVADLRTEVVSALNAERSATVSLQNGLNSLAQSWADKWVSEKWCDINTASCNPLTAPDGTFTDSLRDGGVSETLGAYYRGDSSFENAKMAITENTGMQDSRWKKIGIGIKQDSFGIIHFIITYTE